VATDLKVLFMSVNLMETAPEDGHITQMIKDLDVANHDILVVGEQETKAKSAHTYIPQLVAKAKPGGQKWFYGDPDGDPKKDPCVNKDAKKSRKTATATIGSRTLTCGVTWNEKVNALGPTFDSEVVKGLRKAVVLYTAKGGCVVYMDFKGRRLAFVSCHLNDESTKNRDTELAKILKNVEDNKTDVVFLGGDLNYRPIYEGEEIPESDPTLKAIHADRKGFYTKHDPFGQGKAALVATHKMTFPDPDFWPTYKRDVKGTMNLAANAGLPEITKFYSLPKMAIEVVDGDGKRQKVEAKAGGEVKKKRRGEYAIGWLDRIGYKVMGKGAVKVNWFKSFPSLFKGDHCPVALSTTVSVDLEG